MDRGNLAGCSPWGHMTGHTSMREVEGNGNGLVAINRGRTKKKKKKNHENEECLCQSGGAHNR